MLRRSGARILLLLAMVAGSASAALAHPHVWVTARAELVYEAGKVMGIRHAWTFDKAYSAYVTQGLDANADGVLSPEELDGLARENTDGLGEFGYFTSLKLNGKGQAFASPREPRMVLETGGLTLSYFLPLEQPASGAIAAVEILDPTYFVSFNLADGDAVGLKGAPAGCATNISRPKASAAPTKDMPETFFEGLTAASDFGRQFANKVIVACP